MGETPVEEPKLRAPEIAQKPTKEVPVVLSAEELLTLDVEQKNELKKRMEENLKNMSEGTNKERKRKQKAQKEVDKLSEKIRIGEEKLSEMRKPKVDTTESTLVNVKDSVSAEDSVPTLLPEVGPIDEDFLDNHEPGPERIEVPKKLEKEQDKELEERRAAMEALHAPDVQKAEAEMQAKIDRIEVSPEHRTFIGNFLSEDIKALREEFAIKWFDDHKGELKEIQTEEVQRDFKIKFVMKHWEDRKMEAEMRKFGEGKKPGYNEHFGDKIDNLLTLRHELTRESGVSAASPFLLLNYLMKRIDDGISEMESEKLYIAVKDLAGKTMTENIDKDAERRADEYMSSTYANNKEKYIEKELADRKREIKERKKEEWIDREWQDFQKRGDDDVKNEFLASIGFEPGLLPTNKTELGEMLLLAARTKFSSEWQDDDFYALLEEGYKPYDAAIKGFRGRLGLLLGGEKVVIKKNGEEDPKKMSTKKFDELVEESRKDYEKSIEDHARKELSEDWDDARNISIRIKAKARLRQIAELGPERVAELTAKLREKIVGEFIEKHKAQEIAPEEKGIQPIEAVEAKSEKPDIKEFIDAVRDEKGELSSLSNEADEKGSNATKLAKFLSKWGLKVSRTDLENWITPKQYVEAKKEKGNGLLRLIINSVMPKLPEIEFSIKEK